MNYEAHQDRYHGQDDDLPDTMNALALDTSTPSYSAGGAQSSAAESYDGGSPDYSEPYTGGTSSSRASRDSQDDVVTIGSRRESILTGSLRC